MRSALSTMEVVRPRRLAEALAALRVANGLERPVPLAGGTDLFVALNAGTHAGRRFLDLWGLRELQGIRAGATSTRIGGLATFAAIGEHPGVRRRFPSLVAAAAEVGARQIQNRATIAGNIANASPAGDSLPALLALEAQVHARSVDGERTIPLDAFFLGYRTLALAPDELIVAVTLPSPAPRTFQFFRKVGTRRAQSISKVVLAATLRKGSSGRVAAARVALGSVAPVPLRARGAERALEGERPSRDVARRAREALLAEIAPIDDIRSDRAYRLVVSGNVFEQFLRAADPRFARD